MKRLLPLLLVLSLPALAAGGKLDADDERALRDYQLTTGTMEKLVKVGERMRDYVKEHPEARNGGFMKGNKIDDSVQALQGKPFMMQMLNAEKLAPRDFMLGTLTMMQSGMLLQLRAQYPDSPMPDNVNTSNLALVSKHAELMQKWRAAWEIGARKVRVPNVPNQESKP